MLKRLILALIITTNINCMQKLVLRFSQKQMIKISKALTSELFGPRLKAILLRSTSSLVADKDRKNYTFTFDLDPEFIGTEEVQKENLQHIFSVITKEEEADYSGSCCHPSDFSGS